MTPCVRALHYNGDNIIFIVGCPRSGTTYLQRLIASHPKVYTGQESDVFDLYVGPLLRTWRRELQNYSGRGGVGLACYFQESEFMEILKGFLLQLLGPMIEDLGPDEIFVEKTPSHALFMVEIHQLLPRARFIHILRDPRDVVASLLAASRSWGRNWAPKNTVLATILWRRHVEAVSNARSLIPANQFFEVRYEQLWGNPVSTLEQVSRFIGLNWTIDEIRASVENNRPEVVRKGGGTPIPKKGEFGIKTGAVVSDPPEFIRRGAPGGWRKDLKIHQRFIVWLIAGQIMKEVGYPWGPEAFLSFRNVFERLTIWLWRRVKKIVR